jgi:lipoprotein-releasing system ATP-binding protein
MSKPVLSCHQLFKYYLDGTSRVEVLRGIDLTIHAGERVAIVGPSGSGKSTLLHLLGGLDKPSSGSASLMDVDWRNLSEKKRCLRRNQYMGFIYQFHHLLPEFTAIENVAMPLLIGNGSKAESFKRAQNILDTVGLAHRLHHKPAQLSGGERQRVAIARALVGRPACLLADEPTGNLDFSTAQSVFNEILDLNQQVNCALVIVTHDRDLAARMDRRLTIVDGRVTEEPVETT